MPKPTQRTFASLLRAFGWRSSDTTQARLPLSDLVQTTVAAELLEPWRHYGAGGAVSAVIGERSAVTLTVPDRVIAWVLFAAISISANENVVAFTQAGPFALTGGGTLTTPLLRSTRALPRCTMFRGTTGAGPAAGQLRLFSAFAGQIEVTPEPFPVVGPQVFVFQRNDQNAASQVALEWLELSDESDG